MIHKNEEDQKCLFLQKEYFCLRYNREGKQRMYEEFLKQIEDFIFIEDKPEKADVIFVPGNGYPQMAEKAAQLYRCGMAPKILPSGRYSITAGKFAGVLEKKEYYTGNKTARLFHLHIFRPEYGRADFAKPADKCNEVFGREHKNNTYAEIGWRYPVYDGKSSE